MRIIRSFLCMLCFVIFGIGALGLGGLIFPIFLLVSRNKSRQRKLLAKSVHVSWRGFVWLMTAMRLISVKCSDKKRLRNLHGHIVVANHPSLIDVVILISLIPDCVCVVKQSLFNNFWVKWVIRKIYLNSDMPADEFIKRGTDFLQNGYNIVIFPEGTRTVANRKIRLHRGFAYLHIESKCPILPIHIENNPPILGKKQPWYDVGTKTSVYTITLTPDVEFMSRADHNIRDTALDITKQISGAIFNA